LSYRDTFEEKIRGICKEVTLPVYGSQDVGITPGGVMDQFALDCGNAILDNPDNAPALEMIMPPLLLVRESVYFVITGAPFTNPLMVINEDKTQIEHGTVYFAPVGAELILGTRSSGLRSYLCYKKANITNPDTAIVGRGVGKLEQIANWLDSDGYIRVIKGPEYVYASNPADFFRTEWQISLDMSDMGMRLESKVKLGLKIESMISEAVTNGIIQITPNGPIILLKHRQTVGGYPRVFCVISSDVDLLAQFMPEQALKFKEITIEEAWQIARQKVTDVASLRRKFNAS
jgi:allophanate hydrolase subunit 2